MQSTLEQIKVPFLTVIFALLAFFTLSKLFGPVPFTVRNTNDVFTVDATADIKSVPGTARVSLGVSQTAKTADEAKNNANKVINQITTELKALGVEEKDIKTSNLTSYPERSFSGRDDITGYTVTENLDVTFDTVEKANQGIDLATKAGANQLGGVTFDVADDQKEELKDQAREEAIKLAKEKAKKIAKAAGLKLGRITNVYESGPQAMSPMYDMKAMNAVAEQSRTELNPGENTTSITVTLSYETL